MGGGLYETDGSLAAVICRHGMPMTTSFFPRVPLLGSAELRTLLLILKLERLSSQSLQLTKAFAAHYPPDYEAQFIKILFH